MGRGGGVCGGGVGGRHCVLVHRGRVQSVGGVAVQSVGGVAERFSCVADAFAHRARNAAVPCGGRGAGRNPGEQNYSHYLHGTPHPHQHSVGGEVHTLARARVVGVRMRGVFVRSVAVVLHMSRRRGGGRSWEG